MKKIILTKGKLIAPEDEIVEDVKDFNYYLSLLDDKSKEIETKCINIFKTMNEARWNINTELAYTYLKKLESSQKTTQVTKQINAIKLLLERTPQIKQIAGLAGRSSAEYHSYPKKDILGTNIKKLIQSPEGYSFVTIDFSSCHYRILAALTNDNLVKSWFIKNKDFYSEFINIAELDLTRDQIKPILLSCLYNDNKTDKRINTIVRGGIDEDTAETIVFFFEKLLLRDFNFQKLYEKYRIEIDDRLKLNYLIQRLEKNFMLKFILSLNQEIVTPFAFIHDEWILLIKNEDKHLMEQMDTPLYRGIPMSMHIAFSDTWPLK